MSFMDDPIAEFLQVQKKIIQICIKILELSKISTSELAVKQMYRTSQRIKNVRCDKPVQCLKVWKHVLSWRQCMLLNTINPDT